MPSIYAARDAATAYGMYLRPRREAAFVKAVVVVEHEHPAAPSVQTGAARPPMNGTDDVIEHFRGWSARVSFAKIIAVASVTESGPDMASTAGESIGWVISDENDSDGDQSSGAGSGWEDAKHNWDHHRTCTYGYVIKDSDTGATFCNGREYGH